ncbi:hypothetical protein MRX96_032776 [Rhipicephalus microplus]
MGSRCPFGNSFYLQPKVASRPENKSNEFSRQPGNKSQVWNFHYNGNQPRPTYDFISCTATNSSTKGNIRGSFFRTGQCSSVTYTRELEEEEGKTAGLRSARFLEKKKAA